MKIESIFEITSQSKDDKGIIKYHYINDFIITLDVDNNLVVYNLPLLAELLEVDDTLVVDKIITNYIHENINIKIIILPNINPYEFN